MVKTHRAIHHWDHWLRDSSLGQRVLETEKNFLPRVLSDCYGKHALLVGVPEQSDLLNCSSISHKALLSPILHKTNLFHYIESELYELPIASASIDLVLLPHTLEYLDNPQHLLGEVCRIVKPEGYIIIFGFNPQSLWGLKKYFMKQSNAPWSGNFIAMKKIKKWLTLADFELIKQSTLLFRPPLTHHDKLFQNIKLLEWIGSKCWSPFGGVYVMMAKAKVIPLTPIKLHWKQQLSNVNLSFPRPTARNWR